MVKTPDGRVMMAWWMALCLLLCGMAAGAGIDEIHPKTVEKKEERLPGVALSQGIAEITGVAISPMLGVSSVGAWRYFHTEVSERGKLPWFCHPGVWGTGFGILLLCFLKDTLGTAVPGVLKKPMDMAELFENKASALVAGSAFVPVLAREMTEYFTTGPGAVGVILVPLASVTGDSLVAVSTAVGVTVVSVIVFFVVWLSGHAVNVLIILSPFSLVDAALKASRLAVLMLIPTAYLIAPWLGAAVCLMIIALALWLAPATLRLAVFGTRYAGDVLLPWIGRRRVTEERPHGFTLGKFSKLPSRTPGRVVVSSTGGLEFLYRRWWLGPWKRVALPSGEPLLVKGLLSPSVMVTAEPGRAGTRVVLLLPRYRGREHAMATHLGIREVREHALARGFAAIRNWWREQRGKKLPQGTGDGDLPA